LNGTELIYLLGTATFFIDGTPTTALGKLEVVL
jgi:hypothetical protein